MPRKIAPITSTQKARQNIKLLEDADKLAISKIDDAQYKKVLTEQERQLHHYLMQYTNPDYLPKSIEKEYEFPKYFYYTVNGKNGTVHKRTRTDSAMFARFMKSPSKKKQAEDQGLFKKAAIVPITNIITVPGTKPKKVKSRQPTSYPVEVDSGRPINTGAIRARIDEILADPSAYDDDDMDLIEEYIEEAERDAKIAKDDVKKAQEYAKESAAKVKVLRMAMVNSKEEQLLDWGDSGTPLTFRKFPLSINPTTRPNPRIYDSDEDEAATRALDRFFTLEEKKASAPTKEPEPIKKKDNKKASAPTALKKRFRLQVIKDALDREIIKEHERLGPHQHNIDKNFKKQYKTARQNQDFKNAMATVYNTKKEIETDIPLKIQKLVDKKKDVTDKLTRADGAREIRDLNAEKREIERFIKLEKIAMDNAIKRLPSALDTLEFERKLFYNRGAPTVEIPKNAHKMTISDLLKRGLTKSQIASIKGKGLKKLKKNKRPITAPKFIY